MATASRMNWEAEETDKFIELFCEMKPKGKDTSYSKIREQMKSHGYPGRSDQQMKNHYDGWGRKIKVLDLLLSLTGVGWDPIKQLPIKLRRIAPSVEVYRTKPVRNADKLRYLFFGLHATGRMSFAPGMSSIPKLTSKMKSIRVDKCQAAEESRSPPRSSRKRKSEGGTSESSKRQVHLEATTDLIRLMQVKYLKDLEVKSESSIYEKVAARLEELPLVTQRGPSFMFQVMELIKTNVEMDYFLSFKTEALAWCYITNRVNEAGLGMDDEENVLCVMLLDNVEDLTSEPPSIPRLPKLRCESGGESGGEFIHRIMYQEPETCKEQLRLTPHAFMQLVNLLIDRRSLRDGTKVKVPE
ncbi:hypothetical protein Cgig2_023146 [Carnegiea gigantea]|uniref:Myb/SANT-like domain-containing protein n=1 Tax=Carnegiea gigantea TaxID=171969 RepID=A0A9Q1QGR7_9CARY|nr:hypothetical protein Cgig2_023146 [Carnegiea gigantea]